MNNQYNWQQIKQALKDNFIEPDFQPYSTNAFAGVDFDKGLEIFRYILEIKLPNHDETSSVLEKLNLYAKGNQNKDILEKIVHKYEIYIKKLFYLLSNPFSAKKGLGHGYNELFDKLSIAASNRGIPSIRNDFFDTDSSSGVRKPTLLPTHFASLLTDSTKFGEHLHSSYHNRNLTIHNDLPSYTRRIAEYITDFLKSYLYFTFKYYNELIEVLPLADLISPSTLTIRNLASLSGGAYNPDIENEVKRDNIIQTIENKLKDLDVLFIVGDEGIGKTTILHQFVAKHPDNCFAYFIDGKDTSTYSNLAILQSLSNQLCFISKGYTLEEDINFNINNFTNEDWLQSYFYSEKITSKSSQTYYFIIDGLDEVSRDRQYEIKELILDELSYDKTNFKLLYGGKHDKKLVKQNCKWDKFDITLLTEDESLAIFGNGVTKEHFDDLNRVCKNNAGRIIFFRDLIKKGEIKIENIIDKLSSDLRSVYQYLWDSAAFDKNGKIILAIIAFQDEKYSIKDIAGILNLSEREVISALQAIPFVKKNTRGTYEYIFDEFIDFAKLKLASYKNDIDPLIIKYLLRNIDSGTNSDSVYDLVQILEIYEKKGNKKESNQLLTDERWRQLLATSEKISVVSYASSIALKTFQDENKNAYIPTVLKYSVLKSALNELSRVAVWQYEIEANLVLKDDIAAQNLANVAFLKEDRLKMFASIARAYTERKEPVPQKILTNINELYEDIDASKDFENIRESAVEIASLLMYSVPKLAFRLIEDLSGTISDNDNAFDWALAQISLSVHSNLENLEDVSKEDINTKVYSKIRNPKIKEFTDAILYLSENQTAEEIIERINQLESTSQKMFLIRNWIGNNYKDDSIAQVLELGLKLVVDKSDRYVPKSSDYKFFARPLPNLKDKDKAYELIKKIEQYTASIEANSGISDLLTIKLFIARTLCNFEFEEGEKKLFNIYSEIDKVPDLAMRCTCFAIYANEATKIKNKYQDQNLDMYLDAARNGIRENIDEILKQTASHFEIVQSIITNLVRLYPNDALDICEKLNKSIDRDNAFLEALSTYLKQGLEKVNVAILDKLLKNIVDLDIQEIAIAEIVTRLTEVNDNEKIHLSGFYKYFEKVDTLLDNRVKCLLYIKIISILEQTEQDTYTTYDKLYQTWNELEESVYKIELGFEIAYNAAFLKDTSFAKKILLAAKNEKNKPELLLDSPNTTAVFSSAIELALRVFSGLIIRNNYEQKDIENIENIISSLPSERQQMQLWSILILKIIPKSKDDVFPKQLIKSYIIPKLSKIKNKNERISAIMQNIVVLYFNDNSLPNLNELPNTKMKDIALSKICKYLFTTCLPNDVCDSNNEGYTINFNTAERILDLVNLMENDYFIASQIIELRQSILSKKTLISSQQRISIKDKFEKIANSKLPDLNNIRHAGYQLLVKANALAIQSKSRWEEWGDILQEVETIPNLSDRIFLWDSITELLPNNFVNEKQGLISKAIESVYELPSFLDTVERIGMILFTLKNMSIPGISSRPLLENFVKLINNNPHSPSLRENYKNILDIAYSTDPGIAKTLVNCFDKDIARLNTGAYLGNHLNLLEFQSKLDEKLSRSNNEQKLLESNPGFFNKIVEKKLARLNASKRTGDGLSPKDLVYQLKMASQDSIYGSHNTYSYFIERLVLMYEDTNESNTLIRKSFLELIEVCGLIKLLSIRNSDKIQSLLDVLSTNKRENDAFQSQIEELDQDTQNDILRYHNKGKTAEEISTWFEIQLETVKALIG